MKCPRCGENMKETRGTHHKKKKWKCHYCSKVRFTDLRGKYKKAPKEIQESP
jgi:transposase-like protein